MRPVSGVPEKMPRMYPSPRTESPAPVTPPSIATYKRSGLEES